MEIHDREEGPWTIISISGEIDFHYSGDIRDRILAALSEGRHTLVDLSNTTYINSSGIASLIEGLQHARKAGLKFALAGLGPTVRETLRLARLDQIFTTYDDTEQALQSNP
jgi:anti-sigma B factor antagonist